MKTKNLKRSLLILTSLVILSYGLLISAQEGFNPTTNVLNNTAAGTAATAGSNNNNLTDQVAQKLSALATSTNPADQNVSVDKLQSIIDDSLNQQFSTSDLPTVDPSEIKIEKQNYTGTAAQIAAKKKEDFTNYIVAVYYILASSSPKPITNNADLNSLENYITQTVTSSLTSRNSSGLNELSQSGQKILDQLKDVPVPEDVVDLHTKAIQFAKYAIALKPSVDANTQDPLADLVNVSKMASFAGALSNFSTEMQTKLNEYGINYDDVMKGKISSLGITPPQIDTTVIQSAPVPAATDTTTTAATANPADSTTSTLPIDTTPTTTP